MVGKPETGIWLTSKYAVNRQVVRNRYISESDSTFDCPGLSLGSRNPVAVLIPKSYDHVE
jgi:hypothetical protein